MLVYQRVAKRNQTWDSTLHEFNQLSSFFASDLTLQHTLW
jgi:hypothetical protein